MAVFCGTPCSTVYLEWCSTKVTKAPTLAFPYHRITFPVTNSLSGVHHRRTLINRDLIGDTPTATVRAIALPSSFLAAQGAVEIAPCLFILIDILIHPFMTDRLTVFALYPATDLLGTPSLSHLVLNLLPGGRSQTSASFGCLPALGQVMGFVRPIAPQTTVPPEFPTDRGLMYPYNCGHLGLGLACFHEGMNLIPLFAGQLGIAAHVCSSYFGQ